MTSLPSLFRHWQWKFISSYKVNRIRTSLRSLLRPCKNPRIVWIFGCQRSGTTMLRNFIGFDPRVNDQGEGDPPFFWQVPLMDEKYLRLRPNQEIASLLSAQRSEVVLLKPLHDSQCAQSLLSVFPESKGIWIFRHYHEVILSHLTYYKGRYDALNYVDDLLEQNNDSWKAQGLSQEMREFVREHRSLVTTPTAAFALFWLARNSLLFAQNHSNLITVAYADLVEKPIQALQVIGQHIQLDLDSAFAHLPQRLARDTTLPDKIPDPILNACTVMHERLSRVCAPV